MQSVYNPWMILHLDLWSIAQVPHYTYTTISKIEKM